MKNKTATESWEICSDEKAHEAFRKDTCKQDMWRVHKHREMIKIMKFPKRN